ncbi:MAG: VWA domain-containing protein [Chitinophagaceae bacterium]|nr:VWA domain-containing protein [Chitinophagaceae bacterium]MBK8951200.1 VWA domain-containing protein [Chitinophagaceae bacterium]
MMPELFQHISFAYPAVFALLLLLPVMIWRHVKKSDANQSAIEVSTIHAFRLTTWKNRFRYLPFLLRLLGVTCIIIALARPQRRIDNQTSEGEGIDIVLCMDVSGSMGSRDVAPSRMDAAKEKAEEFIRSRPVDRIGLVVFSGESFTQCPITNDQQSLISQVQSLESRKHLIDGTVIGEGLATAVDRLSRSESKSKVIILLTDGKEDPPATRLIDPLTALEIAKTKGVKVYTIGVSAGASTVIENTGNKKSVQPDFLDEELLRKIAVETGGQYFRARDKSGLKSVYSQIDLMEKTKVEVKHHTRYEEKFLPFLLAALVFLFVEMLLKFTVFRKFP